MVEQRLEEFATFAEKQQTILQAHVCDLEVLSVSYTIPRNKSVSMLSDICSHLTLQDVFPTHSLTPHLG